jgi:hypothetical protein
MNGSGYCTSQERRGGKGSSKGYIGLHSVGGEAVGRTHKALCRLGIALANAERAVRSDRREWKARSTGRNNEYPRDRGRNERGQLQSRCKKISTVGTSDRKCYGIITSPELSPSPALPLSTSRAIKRTSLAHVSDSTS